MKLWTWLSEAADGRCFVVYVPADSREEAERLIVDLGLGGREDGLSVLREHVPPVGGWGHA